MINKLLSNLAFNPSLIEDVAFYTRRLKKEEAIRRTGLVLVVLSLFVQIFAAMVPPEKSYAASDNDVINGGVDTLSELKSKCETSDNEKLNGKPNPNWGAKGLYERFGLSCADLKQESCAKAGCNVSLNFQTQGKNGVKTVGRTDFADTDDTAKGPYGPHAVAFQSRSAAEWRGKDAAYDFGEIRDSKGVKRHIWILKDCGNIAYGKPIPETTGTATPGTGTIINSGTPGFTPDTPPATPPAAPQTTTPEVRTPGEQPPPAAPATPITPVVTVPTVPVCADKPTIPATDENCGTVGRLKTVQNITRTLSPELTLQTKVKAGETLEYSLVTTNSNSAASKTKYVVDDYVGDLLDYAQLDEAALKTQGGTFSSEKKTITWANQTIPAGGKLVKTFRVTMKNPLPTTNQPNATAPDYDCRMQNGYGNEVVVNVECAALKKVETLPNTGPGTTVGIAAAITVISGYFFARSRLLAKELKIVKEDFVTAGS
jgi:hypothetical protein